MGTQNQTSTTSNPAPGAPARNDASGQQRAAFNEAYLPDGSVRSHWKYLLDGMQALGGDEMGMRQRAIEHILRDDGATYNDYGPNLVARPWVLDPIPLLIDSQEWNRIEAGVQERAELLNLVLRDLYGPRDLLRHGVIPAELVFSDHGFLRECHGIKLPGEHHLIQYAADMVRGPDGEMRIISDRTQTPSGAGYALENRQVISRTFPSLFRDSHVHRLSLYFSRLRRTLNSLHPKGEMPQVAILTPGAYNETYFEHAFLANFLGFSLVQGSDLTVRDSRVWMKTLDGLSKIDIILRRVDDRYCDPSELRSDSQLGIPGLLQVVRKGNVVVVNPLGSGILENRGLARYLPAVARHFLGRDLALQSAPTYWCGDPGDLRYTLEKLDQLIVKTAHREPGSKIVFGGKLDKTGLAALCQAITANPVGYIAQEYLHPANIPAWGSDQNVPMPAVLRSFAVAGESSYTVMPGGLTRVGIQSGAIEISNRAGSLSKDTWVLASEPEMQMTEVAEQPSRSGREPRAGVDLPSRVMENLYWVGRYSERADSALRLLRTVFTRLHGDQSLSDTSRALLLRAVTQLTCTYPGFMSEATVSVDAESELLSVVLDGKRLGSVTASLNSLLVAVDPVKDFMSSDTQRILNDLRDNMDSLPARLQRGFTTAPVQELDALITSLLSLAGLAHESMIRGQGWCFLDMGKRIERTLQTISLLRSLWVPALASQDEHQMLESVLLCVESLRSYKLRYQRDMQIANGLDLLLLEANHPRAVIYQLQALGQHLEAIPAAADASRLSTEQRLLLEATTGLRLADIRQLAKIGEGDFLRTDLDQLLARIHRLVSESAKAFAVSYFDHSTGPHPMDAGGWEE